MLRAVLFDLDDTLVDHASAARLALESWTMARKYTSADMHERWLRISTFHYHRFQRREVSFLEQGRARIREFLACALNDEEADQEYAAFLSHYRENWKLFDDADCALRRARLSGLRIGLLTNGDETDQWRKVTHLELDDRIDGFFASSSLGFAKPDRAAFEGALRGLAVNADETVMIGNSLKEDIQGARDAGLSTVLLDRFDSHPQHAGPRVISLDDLEFSSSWPWRMHR